MPWALRGFSTWRLTTSKVAPPSVATKYELVQSVGNQDRGCPNS
jgi:hypothetical protein